jgi:hypothetical protein
MAGIHSLSTMRAVFPTRQMARVAALHIPALGEIARRQQPWARAVHRGSGSAEALWRARRMRPARDPRAAAASIAGFFHMPRFCGTSIGRNSTPDLCTGCG